MDAQALKKLVKLEEIIAETEPLVQRGRYWHGQNHDSLVVKPEDQLYFWNSRNGSRPGDIYTWLMELHGWNFEEALADVARRVGVELQPAQNRPIRSPPPPPQPLSPRTARPLAPPPAAWQQRGRELVSIAQATLWSDGGRPGLEALHRRGLVDSTIRRAGLGWNPADVWDEPEVWGFAGGNKVWVPRGVLIPWEMHGQLWRIRIRRPDEELGQGDSRYNSPRLYPTGKRPAVDHEALYNADALTAGRPAILLEGEIDCLTLLQAAGDLVVPVATGSVSGARRPRWIVRLARCSIILVAFDADQAGDRHAAYWLQVLPNARRWRPFWEDANQMGRDGVDLRAWIAAGLPDMSGSSRFPLIIRWPATHSEAAMPPTWRRRTDGRIEAVYYSVGELEESVQTLALVQTALDLGGVCFHPA